MIGVLVNGSVAAVILYAMVGIFGYVTFYNDPDAFVDANILEAPYGNNIPITIGNFTLFFAILASAPLCVLPAKDTVEELFWKDKGMTNKINTLVTLGLVTVCYLMAVAFK